MLKRTLLAAATSLAMAPALAAVPTPTNEITLNIAGTYRTHDFDQRAAEIAAFDPATDVVLVSRAEAGEVDLLDIGNPANPRKVGEIDVSVHLPAAGSVNGVAASNGLVAVAVAHQDRQLDGWIAFYDAHGNYLNHVPAGALPGAVTFSPDGRYVLAANEGEPSADYSIDPEGSVTVVDLKAGVHQPQVRTAHLRGFNYQVPPGVRISGPGASNAQDLEPESIAVSPDSQWAWVTLQENNAMALVFIPWARVVKLLPLGAKDHSLPGNTLDASDRDAAGGGEGGRINIVNWPVHGLYMPDGADAYRVGANTFIVTANEGDAREYTTETDEIDCPDEPFWEWEEGECTYTDKARVGRLDLDDTLFPDEAVLKLDDNLGRLGVVATQGDTDGDGDYDKLYAYGGRSFSIWTTLGHQVFDSGDMLEWYTAWLYPYDFNSDNDANNSFDSRSDDKGPEPEGIELGRVDGRTYAFVGLERVGGVAIFNITDPYHVHFVGYANNRDFDSLLNDEDGDLDTSTPEDLVDGNLQTAVEAGEAGDLGPEGLLFIPAADSPIGKDLLVVGNEVSGSTSIYVVNDWF